MGGAVLAGRREAGGGACPSRTLRRRVGESLAHVTERGRQGLSGTRAGEGGAGPAAGAGTSVDPPIPRPRQKCVSEMYRRARIEGTLP